MIGLDDQRESALEKKKCEFYYSVKWFDCVTRDKLTGQENSNGNRTVYPLALLALTNEEEELAAVKSSEFSPRTGVEKSP